MLRRTLVATALMSGTLQKAGLARSTTDVVDMLLVLAMDGSGSLSHERLMLQREGHARAVTSAMFLDAVAAGAHGRIAVAAIEWTGHDRQVPVAPWMVIEAADDARRLAAALRRAPLSVPGFTSISGAIDAAVALFASAPHAAERRVIDVSGNGPNNDGRPASAARDDAVAAGVTVNGLPILDTVPGLDRYFAEQVIGGPRAFMVVAQDAESFGQAILRKLVYEIAGPSAGRPTAG